MRMLWGRAEVRAGFWTFILALILLLPGVALFVNVAGPAMDRLGGLRRLPAVVRGIKVERVILDFDQDERAETRQAVDRNLAEFRKALEGMGVQAFRASCGKGKGIDDGLAFGEWISVC